MLEPDAVKVARPVLRRLGAGNGFQLLGEGEAVRPLLYSTADDRVLCIVRTYFLG